MFFTLFRIDYLLSDLLRIKNKIKSNIKKATTRVSPYFMESFIVRLLLELVATDALLG